MKFAIGVLLLAAARAGATAPEGLQRATQLVVVTAADWPDVSGQLWRFERTGTGRAWRAVTAGCPVVVGRHGMGWGRGLDGGLGLPGPSKREGDGRSPAGLFALSRSFGYARPGTDSPKRFPYREATAETECVDDPCSNLYNRIVERNRVNSIDWKSHEDMRRADALYQWVVVVDHNVDPPLPGAGSCIFLHRWRGNGHGTAGCTAMPETLLHDLVFWLDSAAHPVLLQLPRAVYERLRVDWRLPSL